MPTFAYGPLKTLAESLLTQFGFEATLRQVTNSGTAYAPTQSETDTTITVVDTEERTRDASGSLVGQTQRTLFVSTAAGVAPTKGDKVVIGGAEHEVSEVRPLAPGGTTLLYEVDLET